MGLFDLFSNSDAQNAANAQASGYQNAYNALQNNIATGNQNLGQQYALGQGALNTGAGNATGALNQNYGNAIGTLQQQQGVNNAGQTQLANLLGLNGAAGSASAQQALQNMPGYQFALNQGTQNVLRNQAATGQLNSGNTNMDLTNFSQGLASQNYNNYVNQLQPFLSASNTGAANIAGTQTGLGGALAGNYNNLGQNLNANMTGLGNALNQNFNTQGAAAYGTEAGIGNAQAQADYANLAASGSLWGSLLGAAGNALGARPGGSGSPTVGSSIFSSIF